MSLRGLVDDLDRHPPYVRVDQLASDATAQDVDVHADLGVHAITVSRIKRSTTNPILVLTATGSGADDMAAAIGDFAPACDIGLGVVCSQRAEKLRAASARRYPGSA